MQNGISIKGYGNIKSKLEVSYMRDYYIYRNCRLTFHYKISYFNKSRFKQMPLLDDLNVMELKTSINQDNSFLERLFPFQSTSFSKYVRVISKTNFVY